MQLLKRNIGQRWLPSRLAIMATGATLALSAFTGSALAQPELITKDDVITGTMNIEFDTRTRKDTSGDLREGSTALGAKDKYTFNLRVADTTEFTGEVQRSPNLYSKVIGKKKQEASLFFKINLAVMNPKDLKQKKNVGSWVGTVPIDTASGAFDLAGGGAKESALRISIDAVGRAPAFVENFGGRLIGKAEKKETLAAYTFKRVVGNKTVEIKVQKTDPIRFENVSLAKGPSENYPRTSVNGRLDYDYETGNWYTDGLRFKYTLDGREMEDIVTGSIKWVEDPDRKSNGKGYYDFNIRFNETKKGGSESAAFEKMSDEDAFFAVDDSQSCLTGRIHYVDTMAGDTVSASQVTYKLNANKLSRQQIMNFFKAWMLAVGPTNDE